MYLTGSLSLYIYIYIKIHVTYQSLTLIPFLGETTILSFCYYFSYALGIAMQLFRRIYFFLFVMYRHVPW